MHREKFDRLITQSDIVSVLNSNISSLGVIAEKTLFELGLVPYLSFLFHSFVPLFSFCVDFSTFIFLIVGNEKGN